MRRTALALALILVLLLSALAGKFFLYTSSAQSSGAITIKASGNIEGTDKIQRDGDVYLFTGSISGSIVVERDNIIIDGAVYVLQPQNDAGVGVDIRDRNNVTIRNLTITGFIGRCAILLINTNNCDIQNNTLSNNLNGIEMTLRSSRNKIIGNNFENNELGLELYSIDPGSDNLISENEIKNNNFGMAIRDFTSTNIHSNKFEMNKYGFFLGVGSGTRLENNALSNNTHAFGASNVIGADVDTSNTVNGKPIYYWVNEHDKTVPADAGYVALIGCSGITVKNLDLAGNYHGIFLGSTTNSTIINNKFSNNLFGVNLNAASNNTISQNTIIDNENGVGLEAGSSENSIYGNNIDMNKFGVYIDAVSGNSIIGNVIRDSETGVYTQYSGLNIIHHNNFINNSKSWGDTGLSPFWFGPSVSISTWDDGGEGNYWSDYNGTDLNNDGVGDTPYLVGTNNTDRYPLMKPVTFQEFPDGASEKEPFPTLLVLVASVTAVIVGVAGLLVYFKKRKRKAALA
jgi:parallel beta-helix repeat protein